MLHYIYSVTPQLSCQIFIKTLANENLSQYLTKCNAALNRYYLIKKVYLLKNEQTRKRKGLSVHTTETVADFNFYSIKTLM